MSAATELDRAKDAMSKAEAIQNRWTPFSGNNKYKEAAQHYENACNLFRRGKDYMSAGKAALLAADMHTKYNNQYQTIQSYIKAANIFQKENPEDTIVCFEKVIKLYVESDKFSMAAHYQQEIAVILENRSELQRSIDAYELAAEFYDEENNARDATKCLLKVAIFSAQIEKYDRACEIFEKIGITYVKNSLLKFMVRNIFLKGCLCHLANNDLIGARRALDRYHEYDPTFLAQRESKFLRNLMNSIEKSEIENFSQICGEYDSITPLDEWMITILLRIKNSFFNCISETRSSPSSDHIILPEDLS